MPFHRGNLVRSIREPEKRKGTTNGEGSVGLGATFVQEPKVNCRLKSAPEPNFAPMVISSLPLCTPIRLSVMVSAARGDRCHRTTGLKVVRHSHPRTRAVEREPPTKERLPMDKKGLSQAIGQTGENKRRRKRGGRGNRNQQNTEKTIICVGSDEG
jgi:hypothetical protein